ncbi:MAG: thiamine phosphate synthase [Firmicutes bacterium]|nr:thiamine phosphate synthase [Bacillota bacterium]
MDVYQVLQTGIYGITCESISAGRTNIEVVQQLLDAGVKIIQYREKDKTKREKYQQCLTLRSLCDAAGALFIVNDDVDIAMAIKAGGVHVGQDDLPADVVRAIVGPDMVIGVSAGTPNEAAIAVAQGANYLGVGPVFPTGTKLDAGDAVGLANLAQMVQMYNIPVVAIGGINEKNIMDVHQCGVACAAMVSTLVGATDIKETVSTIWRIINSDRR